jgi:hypothetical protein
MTEENMNFTKKSFRASGLLLAAALLSVPMIAQQEVSPDHFDEKPAAVKKHKPATSAAKPSAAKRSDSSNRVASKAKPAPAQSASLQTDSAPVQTAANPR